MRGSAWLSLAALLCAGSAGAYPQYIAKGHAQCEGCHYSPTGGGFITSMGQGSLEALIPDLLKLGPISKARAALSKPELTGRDDEDNPRLQLDVGLDTRVLLLRSRREVAAQPTLLAIPMLFEAGAVAAYGPLLAYGSVTARRRTTPDAGLGALSREHWLSFQLTDSQRLRAGRMVLPFGIRSPDHTLFTREDFGFNKYDQSYALAWDLVGEALEVHAAGFAGNLGVDPPGLQERGAAVSVSHAFLDERLSLGGSALIGLSQHVTRPAVSVFLRSRLWGTSYLVGEAAAQRLQNRATRQAQHQAAGFLRVGWLPHDSTDIFVELSGRAIQGGRELIKLRYQLGVNSHLLPWLELSPALVLEEDVETGLEATVLGQLHLFY